MMAEIIIILLTLAGIGVSCVWVAQQSWPWYGKTAAMLGAVVFGAFLGAVLLLFSASQAWEKSSRR
jgi:hypothetical protein